MQMIWLQSEVLKTSKKNLTSKTTITTRWHVLQDWNKSSCFAFTSNEKLRVAAGGGSRSHTPQEYSGAPQNHGCLYASERRTCPDIKDAAVPLACPGSLVPRGILPPTLIWGQSCSICCCWNQASQSSPNFFHALPSITVANLAL